jgi:hypothetical protein
MSRSVQDRLREFTCRLLERRGAAIEWPEDAAEGLAVVPPDTASALKCLEILPLSFDAEAALPINLATDFLDRTAPLLEAEPRAGLFQAPPLYLKQSDMAEPVARAFTWLNAKVVVRQAKPTRLEYHAWYLRAAVESADRWEEVLQVTINSRSGAEVALGDVLEMSLLQPAEASPGEPPQGTPPPTERRALLLAAAAAEERAGSFVARLESQLDRDRKRLRSYYNALLREDRDRASRAASKDEPEQDESKRRAVELELRRKLAELDERYALRVEIAPLALIRLNCPALAVECEVFRKQARRIHTVYWNPILKELEPIACSACGGSTFAAAFTDDHVQPLCPRCAR